MLLRPGFGRAFFNHLNKNSMARPKKAEHYFPALAQGLLSSEGKGSVLTIPNELLSAISNFQTAFQLKYGCKPNREQTVVLMMSYGLDKLVSQTKEMGEPAPLS